ncbi:D-2-hydroxyacid dehydrogenase [Phycicoccus sp. BSK3Z-2]|uniref:D-2-hydroxyacid dehydrogenase n=1 Tax=Phycicoccus avicenniae TaxID=2828860 RepID=A0A941D9Y1_9MICO|nr:D-2-hydroxyacid dehydrogenase [Phycicoccus avicenniae]MBR7744804.1 D-2-hydroxyacid dehydrogenase [Phycicoccus avicenniae]
MPTERPITTVLATVPFEEHEVDQLREAFAPAELVRVDSSDDARIEEVLRTADVAVLEGDLDQRHLDAPNLAWVHCDHSGLNKSARPEVFEKGLLVSGSAGRSAPALAQHGFFFALSLTYQAKELQRDQANRTWRGIPDYFHRPALWGQTLGVVGFGRTGQEMARLGRAFGMHVVVLRRKQDGGVPDFVDEMLTTDSGDSVMDLADRCDVIMLATQLTDATHHLFSTEQFERMRPSAVLVNISRGPVVDERALEEALRTGRIAGAASDVFATEPLPADSGLWDAPNFYLTPHMTPRMPDKTQRSIDIIVENVRRFRSGETLLNQLTEADVYHGATHPR